MNSFTDRVKRAIAPVLSTVVITVVITASVSERPSANTRGTTIWPARRPTATPLRPDGRWTVPTAVGSTGRCYG